MGRFSDLPRWRRLLALAAIAGFLFMIARTVTREHGEATIHVTFAPGAGIRTFTAEVSEPKSEEVLVRFEARVEPGAKEVSFPYRGPTGTLQLRGKFSEHVIDRTILVEEGATVVVHLTASDDARL
jgi:hypothetical protein